MQLDAELEGESLLDAAAKNLEAAKHAQDEASVSEVAALVSPQVLFSGLDAEAFKATVAAFTDAYNNMVIALRNYKAQEVKGGLGKGGQLKVGN